MVVAVRVPDAAFFTLLRRAGTVTNAELVTARLSNTPRREVRRAALHPGNQPPETPASEDEDTSACGPSFETPRESAAPQDDGFACYKALSFAPRAVRLPASRPGTLTWISCP
jgi:hypothetical protein